MKGYTKEKPNGDEEKKTGGSYIIFMLSLFLEDLGQILCQFLHYEQFETRRSSIAIANSAVMMLLAMGNLKAAFNYRPTDEKT